MNEILDIVSCPHCGRDIEVMVEHGESVLCASCRRVYVLAGQLCMDCGTYHVEKTAVCSRCFRPLSRTCDNCAASNWAADEVCGQCGSPLDIFSGLKGGGERPLTADLIKKVNSESEAASKKRMAGMMKKEAERQADNARREAKKKAEEKKMMLYAVGIFAIVALIITVFALF